MMPYIQIILGIHTGVFVELATFTSDMVRLWRREGLGNKLDPKFLIQMVLLVSSLLRLSLSN